MHAIPLNLPVFLSAKRLRTSALAVSFTLALSVIAYGWHLAEQQTDERYQNVRTLGKAIASASTELLATKDYIELNRILLRTISGPEILRVQVIDSDGMLRAHVYKPNGLTPQFGIDGVRITPPKPTPGPVEFEEKRLPGTENINSDTKWLTIWYPIKIDKFLGWVCVNGNVMQAESSKVAILRESIVTAVLVIALSALLGTFISTRTK